MRVGEKGKETEKPFYVAYDHNMGAVDLMDQLLIL
jgi:hypothetical protein